LYDEPDWKRFDEPDWDDFEFFWVIEKPHRWITYKDVNNEDGLKIKPVPWHPDYIKPKLYDKYGFDK